MFVPRVVALLSSEHGLRVNSRRRWNMTPLLPELEAFPARGVFDGARLGVSIYHSDGRHSRTPTMYLEIGRAHV